MTAARGVNEIGSKPRMVRENPEEHHNLKNRYEKEPMKKGRGKSTERKSKLNLP